MTKHKRKHTKIKKVAMPKAGMLRVEAQPDTVPVVIASAPGVVEVVAVKKDVYRKKGWMDYLFGTGE